MTRKDVTYRLTLPSCLSSFSKTLVIGSSISLSLSLSLSLFNLFSPSPHPSICVHLESKSIKGPSAGIFFVIVFDRQGLEGEKTKTTYRSVRQSRSHSPCLPIMAASTSWRLAGSKYFNPRSRGSLCDTMAARVNGISRVSNGGVYTRIGREEARSAMPTHVSCQDVPRQHASSRNLGEAQGAPLHNPDIYRYLLRHLRDEARIKR